MVSLIDQDPNRNLTNRTSLIPGAVSPIDDQRLIGVCENFPAAFAHVRRRRRRLANVPVKRWRLQVDVNADKELLLAPQEKWIIAGEEIDSS